MSGISIDLVDSSSDEELLRLLFKELQTRTPVNHGSDGFVSEIQKLPPGLRAMAATYELDVSLAMDDLGWHFGNWHNQVFAEETARGLHELGAAELAKVFRQAFAIAKEYWDELGSESWMDWYHGSPLEKAVTPLNKQAWALQSGSEQGILKYWVDYARHYPERIGAEGS
jgi:hypothetical protein